MKGKEKDMRTKFFAVSIIFAILLGMFPNSVFADDHIVLPVNIYSNIYGFESTVQMMVSDGQLYITPEDAAYFSNSSLVDEGNKLQFITSGTVSDEIERNQCIEYDNKLWLPIEENLERLGTTCIEESGILFLYSNSRKDDLVNLANTFMNKSKYQINFLDGFTGNSGVVMSRILDIALNGRFAEVISNRYDYNNYKNIAISLISVDSQDENFISAVNDLHTSFEKASDDYNKVGDLINFFLKNKGLAEIYFGSDYGSDMEDLIKDYSDITSMLKVGEILKGLNYAYSATNACRLFALGLNNTVLKYDYYYPRNKDLNASFRKVITDYNTKASDPLVFYRAIFDEIFNSGINKGVLSMAGVSSTAISVEKRVLDAIFNTSNTTLAVRDADLYQQVQREMTAIYNLCERNGDILGMKYSAIIYLRAGQKAYLGFNFDKDLKIGNERIAAEIENLIVQLALFDDDSLTRTVHNLKIDADGLVERLQSAVNLFSDTYWYQNISPGMAGYFYLKFHGDGTYSYVAMNKYTYGDGVYAYENGILTLDGIDYWGGPEVFTSLEKHFAMGAPEDGWEYTLSLQASGEEYEKLMNDPEIIELKNHRERDKILEPLLKIAGDILNRQYEELENDFGEATLIFDESGYLQYEFSKLRNVSVWIDGWGGRSDCIEVNLRNILKLSREEEKRLIELIHEYFTDEPYYYWGYGYGANRDGSNAMRSSTSGKYEDYDNYYKRCHIVILLCAEDGTFLDETFFRVYYNWYA